MGSAACIRHTELPHVSSLFSDFLYRFDRVARFYAHSPYDPESYRDTAAQMEYPAERRSVLVDLGRVWLALNRVEQARAALLAASRGGEARAAEQARELLPERYPYVPEFRAALEMDPANIELRRELAYLLLKMERQAEAEQEFARIVQADEGDLLSAAQLGFLYLGRGDRLNAMPLLERVLRGDDEELANRVRAVLRMPQILRRSAEGAQAASVSAKQMAERSIRAGYMKDALKYLQVAHEADPVDFDIMLKLGWTYNILRDDTMAARWFGLARRGPDRQLSEEAARAYARLRPGLGGFRASAWAFPMYSSRWRDLFSYGQVQMEYGRRRFLQPYLGVRFVGDARRTTGGPVPQYLSESSIIPALGLTTTTWRGLRAWGEAGYAFHYLNHSLMPDYRAGAGFSRGWGRSLQAKEAGGFLDTSADAVYISRFGKDLLVYSQSRVGYRPELGVLKLQVYGNANLTLDAKRQHWANFVEMGPGVRFRWETMPDSVYFSVDFLRGMYLRNEVEGERKTYFDFRAGVGYAFRY
jgi:tetratricopeptide (TPR) repeat protein